jgi:hypothetical protein
MLTETQPLMSFDTKVSTLRLASSTAVGLSVMSTPIVIGEFRRLSVIQHFNVQPGRLAVKLV